MSRLRIWGRFGVAVCFFGLSSLGLRQGSRDWGLGCRVRVQGFGGLGFRVWVLFWDSEGSAWRVRLCTKTRSRNAKNLNPKTART